MIDKYCNVITINDQGIPDHNYSHSSMPDKFTKYPSNLPIDELTLNTLRLISLEHSKNITLNQNIKKLETKLYVK